MKDKNIDLDNIRDAVYELEGLLELSRLRQDKMADLLPLMKARLGQINSLFGAAETDAVEEKEEKEKKKEEKNVDEMNVEEPVSEILTDHPEETVVENEKEIFSSTADVKAPVSKPAFCINDRFRFRRELFHNSDAEFSKAMDLVATMDSYEEAEEYFLGDLGWDIENEDVKDFMAIIENYFGK